MGGRPEFWGGPPPDMPSLGFLRGTPASMPAPSTLAVRSPYTGSSQLSLAAPPGWPLAQAGQRRASSPGCSPWHNSRACGFTSPRSPRSPSQPSTPQNMTHLNSIVGEVECLQKCVSSVVRMKRARQEKDERDRRRLESVLMNGRAVLHDSDASFGESYLSSRNLDSSTGSARRCRSADAAVGRASYQQLACQQSVLHSGSEAEFSTVQRSSPVARHVDPSSKRRSLSAGTPSRLAGASGRLAAAGFNMNVEALLPSEGNLSARSSAPSSYGRSIARGPPLRHHLDADPSKFATAARHLQRASSAEPSSVSRGHAPYFSTPNRSSTAHSELSLRLESLLASQRSSSASSAGRFIPVPVTSVGRFIPVPSLGCENLPPQLAEGKLGTHGIEAQKVGVCVSLEAARRPLEPLEDLTGHIRGNRKDTARSAESQSDQGSVVAAILAAASDSSVGSRTAAILNATEAVSHPEPPPSSVLEQRSMCTSQISESAESQLGDVSPLWRLNTPRDRRPKTPNVLMPPALARVGHSQPSSARRRSSGGAGGCTDPQAGSNGVPASRQLSGHANRARTAQNSGQRHLSAGPESASRSTLSGGSVAGSSPRPSTSASGCSARHQRQRGRQGASSCVGSEAELSIVHGATPSIRGSGGVRSRHRPEIRPVLTKYLNERSADLASVPEPRSPVEPFLME